MDARLAETIDALPTFLQALGGEWSGASSGGRSLPVCCTAGTPAWRDYAISEYDYAFQAPARERLGQPIDRCRMTHAQRERWKQFGV